MSRSRFAHEDGVKMRLDELKRRPWLRFRGSFGKLATMGA